MIDPITPIINTITTNEPKRKKTKIILPDYLSNLQDLMELEDYGEKVIWPDGLCASQARALIKEYEAKWKQLQAEVSSQPDHILEGGS